MLVENVCPWRLHASVPKSSDRYFKVKSFVGDHTCSQPSLRTNHRKAIISFVCNVIMLIVRTKVDSTPRYIIDYIGDTYHINRKYNKVWNARTKSLMKIIGD